MAGFSYGPPALHDHHHGKHNQKPGDYYPWQVFKGLKDSLSAIQTRFAKLVCFHIRLLEGEFFVFQHFGEHIRGGFAG